MKVAVRMWSAMTRRALSASSADIAATASGLDRSSIAFMIGKKISVS